MKIRCTDCTKKISIDDAFAGGVCRCPYCSALVFVPDEDAQAVSGGDRPASPTARPQTPAEMEAVAKARGQEHIPVASPVKIQGIITMVLIGLLLVMFIAAAVLYMVYRGPGIRKAGPQDESTINPFIIKPETGPAIAGNIRIEAPVVYVADAGGGMTEIYDYINFMFQKSIPTLGDGQAAVILAREKEPKILVELKPASSIDIITMDTAYSSTPAEGSSDVPLAFKAAVNLKPKTIVLVTHKALEAVDNLIAMARENGITVHTILVAREEPSVRKLAKETGGTSRYYSRRDLNTHRSDM
ncbi:MAG: hypothetical protein BWX88_00017 [Planctomycetes bacterium ADurb.Bin126]|nr:MAG: hypothetical protein BWX88_00017 [Planctomycetes bacterium ADurb.Bin126]HOD81325.1 hypothetical protein [Phycisphaerae bacterium]HQL74575.1 hypothetical protein [Phycisphaerae bacterium]